MRGLLTAMPTDPLRNSNAHVGEEIMSGAQRVHDAQKLEASAVERGIKLSEIQVWTLDAVIPTLSYVRAGLH